MRLPYELAAAVPAVTAGLSVGKAVESLHAPSPWPTVALFVVTLLAALVLDRLIDPIRVYRAARRG